MKLLIAGSRGITEFDLSEYVPKHTIDYARKRNKPIKIIIL